MAWWRDRRPRRRYGCRQCLTEQPEFEDRDARFAPLIILLTIVLPWLSGGNTLVESQPDWMKKAPVWVQEGRQLNEAEWLAGPHLIWMVSYLLHEQQNRPGEDRRHDEERGLIERRRDVFHYVSKPDLRW